MKEKECKVRDITIIYREEDQEKISAICKMIEYNYGIFIKGTNYASTICLFNTNRAGVFSCPNIEEFMHNTLIEFYYDHENIRTLKHPNYTYIAYRTYLNKLLYGEDTERYPIEELIKYMGSKYFIEIRDIPRFVEYLKTNNPRLKEETLNWYKEKERYHVYEKIIEEQFELFPQDKEELKKELELVIPFMTDLAVQATRENHPVPKERISLVREECFHLLNKYLEYIHAPKEWIQLFNQMKKKKKIVEGKHCICYDDKIEIPFQNNLEDPIRIIHEFSHFLAKEPKYYSDNPFVELPSIYHEINMKNFLLSQGYPKEDASSFYYYRIQNETNNYLEYFDILLDIYRKAKNIDITEEILLADKVFKELKIRGNEADLQEEILKKELDQEIDQRTILLLSEPDTFVKVMQYMVNLFLVIKVMEKQEKNPGICDIMNEITEDFNRFHKIEEMIDVIEKPVKRKIIN